MYLQWYSAVQLFSEKRQWQLLFSIIPPTYISSIQSCIDNIHTFPFQYMSGSHSPQLMAISDIFHYSFWLRFVKDLTINLSLSIISTIFEPGNVIIKILILVKKYTLHVQCWHPAKFGVRSLEPGFFRLRCNPSSLVTLGSSLELAFHWSLWPFKFFCSWNTHINRNYR